MLNNLQAGAIIYDLAAIQEEIPLIQKLTKLSKKMVSK